MTFGELVLLKRRPVSGLLGKLACMWNEGSLLGGNPAPGEYMIGTSSGVETTRAIARMPLEDR